MLIENSHLAGRNGLRRAELAGGFEARKMLASNAPAAAGVSFDLEAPAAAPFRMPDDLPPLRLLVAEDDPTSCQAFCEVASSMGFMLRTAASVSAALGLLRESPADVVLVALRLPGGGGLELLNEARRMYPRIGVVVMTAYASVDSGVEALRIGADDYLTKPFQAEELTQVLARAAQRVQFDLNSRILHERLRTSRALGGLVGTSPAMQKVYRILSKVSLSSHPVLILGESGTGKEVIARSIHANGPNASKPFVVVDCGALVSTLIESELFGHTKGAFTGANLPKEGLLAAAKGGTVFLDEIAELPLDVQSKFLRALQEKEVRPVGSNNTVPISARVLAATNRDLSQMVAQGQFRKDLFFRLNVVNLKVPALRERREDIPLLAQYFLERIEQETGKAHQLSEQTLRLIGEYEWPGNVRELQNAIERMCAISTGPVLHTVDLPSQLQDFRAHREESTPGEVGTAEASTGQIVPIADLEKQAILSTIRQLNGDKLMAARLLGIGKTTLYRKLKEYGLSDNSESMDN